MLLNSVIILISLEIRETITACRQSLVPYIRVLYVCVCVRLLVYLCIFCLFICLLLCRFYCQVATDICACFARGMYSRTLFILREVGLVDFFFLSGSHVTLRFMCPQ